MSVRMNGYERNIANQLQRNLSKREAESAIYEIRENLYGDAYTQIHPNLIGNNNNTVSKEWPPVKALLWAYYNGNYDIDALRNFNETIEHEKNDNIALTKNIIKENESLRVRMDLEPQPNEGRKSYVKRWREQNPYKLYDIGGEWRHVYIKENDIEKFYKFADEHNLHLGEECETIDSAKMWRMKDSKCDITFHADGQTAIAIYDALIDLGIKLQVDIYMNDKVYNSIPGKDTRAQRKSKGVDTKMNNVYTAEEISSKLGYRDVVQNSPHHFGTLNQHVDAVVKALPDKTSELVKLAALYHDIGKFETISTNPKTGYSQFIGHADKSVEILAANKEKLCPALSDKDFKYLKELIRLHDTKYSKQGKCQTMLNEHPNGFAKDLIALQYADIMGQSELNREQKLQDVKKFAYFIKSVGTPEQTKGINDVVYTIDNSIKEAHEKYLEEEKIANTPKKTLIKEAQTAENDEHIKYTDLHQLPRSGSLLPTYKQNGIEVSFYGGDLCAISIDNKDITDIFDIPEADGIDDEIEFRMSAEEKNYVLNEINKREGRDLEPIEAVYEEILPEKKEFLARTASNKDVFIDSDTLKHLQAHPELKKEHVVEAIGKMNFIPNADGSFCKMADSIELGKVTGHDSLVEITKDNEKDVQSLYRIGRDNPSNVIIGEGPETTKMMVALGQFPKEGIMLFTACPGELAPPENDIDFWSKHALYCTEDVIDKERSSSLSQTCTNALSSLKEQISSSKNAIKTANGQVQQNISAHEKQADEIVKNKNNSELSL